VARFVLHWYVEDPAGPMRSGNAPNAAALEAALRQLPGRFVGTLGHPGKRFAVACRAVPRLTMRNRATTKPALVTCPKCRKIITDSPGGHELGIKAVFWPDELKSDGPAAILPKRRPG
jgi:hypothetical protein